MSQEEISFLRENVLMGFTDPQYGRRPAWHFDADDPASVANHYPAAVPVDEVLEKLFNWRVIEADVVAQYEVLNTDLNVLEPMSTVDETRKALVRSDTGFMLGVHKKSYLVHPYQDWLLEKVAEIIGDDLSIGSALVLRGGALAAVSIELPETIKTKSGVPFLPKLLARTSHDGTASSTYSGHCLVVECDNTLSAATLEGFKDGRVFRVRHTAHSDERVATAHEALDLVHTMGEAFEAEIETLVNTKVSDKQFQSVLDIVVPIPEKDGRAQTTAQAKQAILQRMWAEDERVSPWRGTAWGVLQSTNTAERYEYGVRGDRAERNSQRDIYGQFAAGDVATLEALKAVLV